MRAFASAAFSRCSPRESKVGWDRSVTDRRTWELLESELFGHVKGAFTGAIADRKGSFRQADGGTLLLDEIGDLSLELRAKLLRVLEEPVVTPIGAARGEPVDLGIVAATHRDVPKLFEEGKFRQHLYFRLYVLPIHIPSLRERPADIADLAAALPTARRGTRTDWLDRGSVCTAGVLRLAGKRSRECGQESAAAARAHRRNLDRCAIPQRSHRAKSEQRG